MKIVFGLIAGCGLMVILLLGSCIGCTALVIHSATQFEVDERLLLERYQDDLDRVSTWLSTAINERDVLEIHQRIMGIVRQEDAEYGTGPWVVVWARFDSFEKQHHMIWNGTGYAQVTIDGQQRSVALRHITSGHETYYILIDDPVLLLENNHCMLKPSTALLIFSPQPAAARTTYT